MLVGNINAEFMFVEIKYTKSCCTKQQVYLRAWQKGDLIVYYSLICYSFMSDLVVHSGVGFELLTVVISFAPKTVICSSSQ